MTQPDPQQVQALAIPPDRAATNRFAVTVQGMRTVALSLLVDRALSA